jgi:hypothetical protein
MKKLFSIIAIHVLVILSLQAQPVTGYSYKYDNGITVKTERCWSQVWVQQSYAAMTATDKTSLNVDIRTLGDLISGSSFKLLSSGKEVKMQGAAPGTYDLKLSFKLTAKPGTLGFTVGNVLIKPKTKTKVSITLYDYQIMIAESQASHGGLSSYESAVNRCKTNTIQDIYFGVPTFYAPGKHDKPIPPDEADGNTKGSIKPETYDVLISVGISGQTHKIWLENFKMQPDTKYAITTNLNAGGITYTGAQDVKGMYLYPAGTAARQTGTPAPIKNIETISYEKAKITNCCSPGTYDVLLNFGNKFEWRKSIAVTTGTKAEVK